MLQNDAAFDEMLKLAGVCVLWELDDMLQPEHAEVPFLFHEMMNYYHTIMTKLSPVTPETQEMVQEQVDDTQDQVHDMSDSASSHLQMTSLLHQLQHMCHRG